MSKKSDLIGAVVRQAGLLSQVHFELLRLMGIYKDEGWTTGGADEITQDEITTAGFDFTPGEFKAVVDTTAEALDLFLENGVPAQSDYTKKINLVLRAI